MRERAKTGMVLAVVAALAIAVAVDATRGGGDEPPAPQAGAEIRPGQLTGTLWYATTSCDVVVLDLVTLASRRLTGDGGHCRFWPSPDGRLLAMHVGRPFARPRALQLLDVASGEVRMPFGRPDYAVAPPAWSPDSTRLVVCDARRPGGDLVALRLPAGAPHRIAQGSCFPGFAEGVLVQRRAGPNAAVLAGRKQIATAATLTELLDSGVEQLPGIAARGETIAVPATRITGPAIGSATTVIVFFDADGTPHGVWNTFTAVHEVGLLGDGTLAFYRAADGFTVRAVAGSSDPVRGLDATAIAASPDGELLALSTAREVRFLRPDGSGIGKLPIAARWLAWTAD